jgi:hypothetical protein
VIVIDTRDICSEVEEGEDLVGSNKGPCSFHIVSLDPFDSLEESCHPLVLQLKSTCCEGSSW